MRILILAALAALAGPSTAAFAQSPAPAPATRAMAAGYKALIICGAV